MASEPSVSSRFFYRNGLRGGGTILYMGRLTFSLLPTGVAAKDVHVCGVFRDLNFGRLKIGWMA